MSYAPNIARAPRPAKAAVKQLRQSDAQLWHRVHSLEETVSDLQRVILNLTVLQPDARAAGGVS